MTQKGEQNPNWRGGRSVTSHGYVIVRVGKDHHLADIRGYAYEHRIVAERKLGRRLKPGELIHHINDNRIDNRPENLRVVGSNAEHFVYHRKREDLRQPGEPNPVIECRCGCGETFEKYDSSNRPREYVSGHNPQPAPARIEILRILERGPMHRNQIAKLCSRTPPQISSRLSALRNAGKVKRVGLGVWALVNDPAVFEDRENPLVICACGCGEEFLKFDKHWRPRRFVSGHNMWKGKKNEQDQN